MTEGRPEYLTLFHFTATAQRRWEGGRGREGEPVRRGVREASRHRLCTTAEASLGPPLARFNTHSAGRPDRAGTRQRRKENTPVSEAALSAEGTS